jgi:hypothetical protein
MSSASLTGENCEEWKRTVPVAAGAAAVVPGAGAAVPAGAGVVLPPQAATTSAVIRTVQISHQCLRIYLLLGFARRRRTPIFKIIDENHLEINAVDRSFSVR